MLALVFFVSTSLSTSEDKDPTKCTVYGKVLDSWGKPVEKAKIEVRSREIREVFTDKDGFYQAAGLQAGTCFLAYYETEYFSRHKILHNVAPGQKVKADFVPKKNAAALCGAVLDIEGKPLPDCKLLIDNADYDYFEGAEFTRINTRTNAQGFFEVDNLIPGSFDITLSNYRENKISSHGDTVVLEKGIEKEVTLRIRPYKIQGKVIIEGGIPEETKPIKVYVYREGNLGGVRWTCRADEKGRFLIDNLHPGSFEARAYLSGYTCNNITFTITEDMEPKPVEISLLRSGYIIFNITDKNGDPVRDAFAKKVNDGEKEDWIYLDEISKGRFKSSTAFKPGEYEFIVHNLAGNQKCHVKVKIKPGQDTEVSVQLSPE